MDREERRRDRHTATDRDTEREIDKQRGIGRQSQTNR